MKKWDSLVKIFIGTIFLWTGGFAKDNVTLNQPPAPTIPIPPPKDLDEAIKRIPDFIKFSEIVPPVINKTELMKSFFGNYTPFIQELLASGNISQINNESVLIKESTNKQQISENYIDKGNFSLKENKDRLSYNHNYPTQSKEQNNNEDLLEDENKESLENNKFADFVFLLSIFLAITVILLILLKIK